MRHIKAAVLVGLGCVLCWLVVSRSFVAYLASAAPGLALAIDPSVPGVLVAAADTAIETPSGAQNEKISAQVAHALSRDPLNARAVAILGEVAAHAGDIERTRRAMRAAARLSIRESRAVHWLMIDSAQRQDVAGALHYADALVRHRPRLMTLAMPVLTAMAESGAASGLLHAELERNPPWRGAFFSGLAAGMRDPRTPVGLLLALKGGPAPPTVGEIGNALDALIARGHYELAYYTWLQLLPAEHLASTGFLFNGEFRLQPSGLPFDWMLRSGPGVSVDVAAAPGETGRRALVVEFGVGRVEFPGVWQLILLGPGSYRLQGRHKGEITGRRGLRWRLGCVGSGQPPIGEGPMLVGTVPVWTELDVPFTVPAAGCRAQSVRLELDARSPSEQLVTGTMWFDRLGVTRSGPPQQR